MNPGNVLLNEPFGLGDDAGGVLVLFLALYMFATLGMQSLEIVAKNAKTSLWKM